MMTIIDFYLAESISKLTVLRDEIVSVEDKASIRQMIAELKAIKEYRLETHPAHTQQAVDIGERVEKANELELYFGAIGLQETEIEKLKAAYPHEYLVSKMVLTKLYVMNGTVIPRLEKEFFLFAVRDNQVDEEEEKTIARRAEEIKQKEIRRQRYNAAMIKLEKGQHITDAEYRILPVAIKSLLHATEISGEIVYRMPPETSGDTPISEDNDDDKGNT